MQYFNEVFFSSQKWTVNNTDDNLVSIYFNICAIGFTFHLVSFKENNIVRNILNVMCMTLFGHYQNRTPSVFKW